MKKWTKKDIQKDLAKQLCQKYGLDALTASILIRRGITQGSEILYFLEDDKRFLHNPFEFNNMEDAVDRIYQAKEEGEIVLIFGDRDVDGITSTTVLYEQLKSMGIDVSWRLPSGNDGYGLSMEAVDDFYNNNGTLIITVDCGISNTQEIAHAGELGIDVIVLDHHNPPEKVPEPAIIVNPKCSDSGYPFTEISGCAVVFKTVCALRFAKSDLYKQEMCLLSISKENEANRIDCIKVQNLVKKDFLSESIVPGSTSISNTKLIKFLQGQQIFVWNKDSTIRLLKETFGSSVDFNFFDIGLEIQKEIPQTRGKTLKELSLLSKIARYYPQQNSEIDGFYNIFVTYIERVLAKQFPEDKKSEEEELQLVALAALADIMPLINENRILVRQGIKSINEGKSRKGLKELLSKLRMLGTPVNSTKLSWNVVPVLNATGRLGQPELGMELFLEKDGSKRNQLAQKIIELNDKRRELGTKAWEIGSKVAEQSIKTYDGKLCIVIDENINRGVSGILAGKLVSAFNVPSMAVTFVGETAVGSMRSCRGFEIPPFLDKMADIFINHGGHNQAAGFSFEKSRLEEFKSRIKALCPQIKLSDDDSQTIEIDAEIPQEYLKPEILKTIDLFEPYGEENPELTFLSRKLTIYDAMIMGKPEPTHLKLIMDCGKTKWPAIFFGEAQRLHRDFDKGDHLDIIYQIQRNFFNGNVTPQIILTEAQPCT